MYVNKLLKLEDALRETGDTGLIGSTFLRHEIKLKMGEISDSFEKGFKLVLLASWADKAAWAKRTEWADRDRYQTFIKGLKTETGTKLLKIETRNY